jgi:hypothetical protein
VAWTDFEPRGAARNRPRQDPQKREYYLYTQYNTMKFIKLWIPVFSWCWVIFYLSSIPNLNTGWGTWDLILRKAAHITEYFILTVLLYRAFKGSFNFSSFYLLFWSSVLSFLYAVSDEIHQAFVPTRSPSPKDVFMDSLGIIAFYLLIKYGNKFRKTVAS